MLILTDRPSMGEQLRKALEPFGRCYVITPSQGRPSLPAVQTVVCDVPLDSVHAADVHCILTAVKAQGDPPVLFLLRDPSLLTEELARSAGASVLLRPPFVLKDVVAKIRVLHDARSASAASADAAAQVRAGAEKVGVTLSAVLNAGARRQAIPMASVARAGADLLDLVSETGINTWLETVRRHDDATFQHCLLVAGLGAAFANELGLPVRQRQQLAQGALLHDIGKARIPAAILNKPGPLTPEEAASMQKHPAFGYEMLVAQAGIDPVLLDITRHHHEMLDGSGYPDGLRGEAIPRLVRMATICDIYAALVERRSYRAPMPADAAFATLLSFGDKLDGPLLRAFRPLARASAAWSKS